MIEKDWSTQQLEALDAINKWLVSDTKQVFYLAGYAGTGKSTLAKHIADTSGCRVTFVAPTGKAAKVLQDKGCPATTIHELIYKYQGSSKDEMRRLLSEKSKAEAENNYDKVDSTASRISELKKQQEILYFENKDVVLAGKDGMPSLIIVDEASMVSEVIGDDLVTTGSKILGLGDQGQLPPVGAKAFFARNKPDYELTEIHRQARGSAIITIAEKIRKGDLIRGGYFGNFLDEEKTQAEVEYWPKSNWSFDFAKQFDKIIVGKNLSRFRINKLMRKELGFTGHLPQAGDKIICTKNVKRLFMVNGGEGVLTEIKELYDHFFFADIMYEGKKFQDILISRYHFEQAEVVLKGKELSIQEFEHGQDIPGGAVLTYFDFAYAITGHKSQGSQWDQVLICDDGFLSQDRGQRIKWFYTAFTRAAKRVVVLF